MSTLISYLAHPLPILPKYYNPSECWFSQDLLFMQFIYKIKNACLGILSTCFLLKLKLDSLKERLFMRYLYICRFFIDKIFKGPRRETCWTITQQCHTCIDECPWCGEFLTESIVSKVNISIHNQSRRMEQHW